ncbi:MAG: glycosyl hydrolase 53 family protein, partial [Flavobacteriaceae bacterium]|nr:glycosyl hydrolase 53 family protein [Flavobacteriaceae bacterium]
ISWITEMEDNGYEWKDNDGNTTDIFQLLKAYNMNIVRLRVWVNPETSNANGWCDIDDLVVKAERAKNAGLDVMLTIHYSDWWADPGKQNKPQAWATYSMSQLETAVANHTTGVLNGLSAKNITPKYIQIGNETDNGMLWDTGKASVGGFSNYAKFINAGAEAVKNFNSNIKTIIHISNGFNNDLFKWNIDGLLSNGLVTSNIDVIGLSLYPAIADWKVKVDETYDNMIDLQSRYQKEVMMVEVGHPNDNYDVTYQFLVYMIEKTKQANGLGVLYWEPAVFNGWRNYNKGAWDDDGSPSVAMDAFKNNATLSTNSTNLPLEKTFKIYPNPSNSSVTLSANHQKTQILKIYDVHGKLQKQVTINSIQKEVDISTLATGVYFFKADGFVEKFIKN